MNIETSQPLELLCVDFLKLEPSKGNVENVLVITDHFSRFAQAFPTRNQTAKTTAKVIFDHFVVHYGTPSRIHSDQGRNFTSSVIRHLCKLLGVTKTQTTPYHPMGNGQCERFNSTLLGMLGTLDNSKKSDWKAYVPSLVHAYNCTRNEVTGYSPHYIMFGRHPRLPVDLILGRPRVEGSSDYGSFVDSLKKRLQYAYKVASDKVAESQRSNKERYDMKTRGAVVAVGDFVLVRNVGLKGAHKIADRWGEEVYKVLRQPSPGIPVFVVKRADGVGAEKTLHRNLLLPFSSVPPADLVKQDPPAGKVRKAKESRKVEVPESVDAGSSSSSEEGEETVWPVAAPRVRPVPLPRVRPVPAPRLQHPAEEHRPVQVVEDVPVVAPDVQSVASGSGSDESVMEDVHSEESGLEVLEPALEVEGVAEAAGPEPVVEPQPDAEVAVDDSDGESPDTDSPQPLRRSTRQRRPPDRFDPQVYEFAQRAYSADVLTQRNHKLSAEVKILKNALRSLLEY